MNVVITLPKHLIDCIISGDKLYEMRKSIPKLMKLGVDGFYAVEKGTSNVRCWCRVDRVCEVDVEDYVASMLEAMLCVDKDFIRNYAADKRVFVWKIGKVIKLDSLDRRHLCVDRNPQQFAYCPLSYGESY